ncbi:MAG: hypothetical protein WD898_03120 [Candidatus Paceibacterota bacterium]
MKKVVIFLALVVSVGSFFVQHKKASEERKEKTEVTLTFTEEEILAENPSRDIRWLVSRCGLPSRVLKERETELLYSEGSLVIDFIILRYDRPGEFFGAYFLLAKLPERLVYHPFLLSTYGRQKYREDFIKTLRYFDDTHEYHLVRASDREIHVMPILWIQDLVSTSSRKPFDFFDLYQLKLFANPENICQSD